MGSRSRIRPPREVLAWLTARYPTDIEVATVCGVTPATVRRWRRALGVERPTPAQVDRETVYDLYVTRQLSIEATAAKLGRSKDAVRVLMRRYGIAPRKRGWVAGRHHHLPMGQLPDSGMLRRAYEAGATIMALAAIYHVSPTTIYQRLQDAGTTFRPRGRPRRPGRR